MTSAIPINRRKIKKLGAFGFLALIVVIGAACYWRFWRSRPIGTGPAGPSVPATRFSKPWSAKPILLVGIGDSVTAGFGARRGYSYFDRLVTNPSDEYEDMSGRCLQRVLPHLQFTNLAISGSTSGQHLSRQLPRLTAADSNTVALVVMTTGGNDIIHNYGRSLPHEEAMYGAAWPQAAPWVTNFEQRLETMVEQINAHFPGGCHIFLANIFDPTDGIGDIRRTGLPAWRDGLKILAAYNDSIRKCSERHPYVHLVDIHNAFLGHGIHCTQFWAAHYDSKDPHYCYYVNLEDPNERGYDVIRRLILLEIAKVADQLN